MPHQHFYLDEEATLEWLPQDTIIFPGANAALRSVFHCRPPARCWRGAVLSGLSGDKRNLQPRHVESRRGVGGWRAASD
ncbi:MAG: urease accessory protein UreD [Enterobacter hormaechei]